MKTLLVFLTYGILATQVPALPNPPTLYRAPVHSFKALPNSVESFKSSDGSVRTSYLPPSKDQLVIPQPLSLGTSYQDSMEALHFVPKGAFRATNIFPQQQYGNVRTHGSFSGQQLFTGFADHGSSEEVSGGVLDLEPDVYGAQIVQDLGGFSGSHFLQQDTGGFGASQFLQHDLGGLSGSHLLHDLGGLSSFPKRLRPCPGGYARNAIGVCDLPRVTKNVFLYTSPIQKPIIPPRPKIPKPKLHYNYVYVNSNNVVSETKPIVIPPAQQKTLVYVLNKVPAAVEPEVIEVPSVPEEPEVFFINYKEGENQVLPGGVDLQSVLGRGAVGETLKTGGTKYLGGISDISLGGRTSTYVEKDVGGLRNFALDGNDNSAAFHSNAHGGKAIFVKQDLDFYLSGESSNFHDSIITKRELSNLPEPFDFITNTTSSERVDGTTHMHSVVVVGQTVDVAKAKNDEESDIDATDGLERFNTVFAIPMLSSNEVKNQVIKNTEEDD